MNESLSEVWRSMIASSRSLGIVITVSAPLAERFQPGLGLLMALAPLEFERLGDHCNGQGPSSDARLAMTGAAPGAGATAQARRDKHHVGAVERLYELVRALERCLSSHVRVGSSAEALGEFAANLHFHRSGILLKGLQVGVGHQEVDALEAGLHHPRDGVAAAAADAHDLDARAGTAVHRAPDEAPTGDFLEIGVKKFESCVMRILRVRRPGRPC